MNQKKWLILLALLGLGVGVYWVAQRGDKNVTGYNSWSGLRPYRWLVLTKDPSQPMWLFEYTPVGGTLVAVLIPADIMMETAGNYGNFRTGSLRGLGEQDDLGLMVVTNTLMRQLGIGIQTAVIQEKRIESKEAVNTVIAASLLSLIKQQVQQDPARLATTLRLGWLVHRMDQTKRLVYAADQIGVTQDSLDVDGAMIRQLDKPAWDAWWDKLHTRIILSQERISVAVENNTGVSGAAAAAGRVLSRDGYEVIAVTDGRNTLPRTLVVVESEALLTGPASESIRWIFPEADWRVGSLSDQRSQIMIRVGIQGQGLWLGTN